MTQESPQPSSNVFSLPVQTSSLAIASLVSGIACWFVLPLIGALLAVITGYMAKKEIRLSEGRLSGMELANAGLVLGYVHLALSAMVVCVLMVIIVAVIIMFVGAVEWSGAFIHVYP